VKREKALAFILPSLKRKILIFLVRLVQKRGNFAGQYLCSMRIVLLSSLFVFLLSSCAQSGKQENQGAIEELDARIMRIHDEAMPKISKVLSLRKLVQQKIDSCQNSLLCDQWQEASYQLTRADAQMMDWMRKYQKPLAKDTALSYLTNQEQIISKVSLDINTSISLADSLLNAIEP
jgi:hypothetical protein